MTDRSDDLLTTGDLAAMMGVTTRTVARWRWHRTGPPFIRLGTARQAQVRYRRADVDAWLASRGTT